MSDIFFLNEYVVFFQNRIKNLVCFLLMLNFLELFFLTSTFPNQIQNCVKHTNFLLKVFSYNLMDLMNDFICVGTATLQQQQQGLRYFCLQIFVYNCVAFFPKKENKTH